MVSCPAAVGLAEERQTVATMYVMEFEWDENKRIVDCPEITPELFASSVVHYGSKDTPKKTQITLCVDSDVLEWFKTRGGGYEMQINAILRAYIDTHND